VPTAAPSPARPEAAAETGLGRLLPPERANTLTHALGAAGALLATLMLLPIAAAGGTPALVSLLVFGGSAVLLYATSSLLHALPPGGAQRLFLILDHCGIFLLIAATYTPFALLLFRSPALLVVIWSIAALGMTGQILAAASGRAAAFEAIAYILYLAMGWLPLAWFAGTLLDHFPAPGLPLLVGGGIAYSVGVLFYRQRRLRYGHAIWHIFSVAGTALHFGAVATLL
jgi:hemolysin III